MVRFAFMLLGIVAAAAAVAMLADWAGYSASGGAIGGAIAGLVGALIGGGSGTRICQQCGSVLPGYYKPSSLKQKLTGGWRCPNCGIEVNRRGYPVH